MGRDTRVLKVLVVNPTGNSNVKALVYGLDRKNILFRFYTTFALFKSSFYYGLTKFSFLQEFRKREYDVSIKTKVVTKPTLEFGRLLSSKLNLSSLYESEESIFSIEKNFKNLEKHASKVVSESTAVYAYEDGAGNLFRNAKTNNILCLYDLPIGYWRSMHKLLDIERKTRPEWSKTLTGFQDSKRKLENKDNEIELADTIFVASSFTKKTLEEYPGTCPPVYVIPYGFPEIYRDRNYSSFEKRKLNMIFVGGLSQRKGFANVLEAYEALKDKVNLTVIGKRSVSGCEVLERKLKHSDFNWIESLPNTQILEKMREHDVLVFPSLFEGYGLVITEAMSQGTPVITTERTCGTDFIQDGENGWIVEPGNTGKLIEKIENILHQPERYSDIAKNSLLTASKYPMSSYGNRMAEKISELLTSKRSE